MSFKSKYCERCCEMKESSSYYFSGAGDKEILLE